MAMGAFQRGSIAAHLLSHLHGGVAFHIWAVEQAAAEATIASVAETCMSAVVWMSWAVMRGAKGGMAIVLSICKSKKG